MSAFSQLTPPLETFPGITTLLPRFAQVCVRTMPLLLTASAAIAAVQVGLSSLPPVVQQAGIGPNFAILFPFIAIWVVLITALDSFIATAVSVALGATTIPLGQALKTAAGRLPRVIGYSLVALGALLVGGIFLVLPGVYLALRLFPIALVALFEPSVNALKRSWEITEGHALEVFVSYILVLAMTLIPSVVIGLLVGFLPSIPGLVFLLATLSALLTYCIPFVFWLLLYGWFRSEIYDPPVAGPEEAYAEA